MSTLSNSKHRRTGWACFVLIGLAYLLIAVMANADLTAGRFVLHMDERLIFDGVHNIVHPQDWPHFTWAVLDGNDHRYGRSLWNSLALFSYIPAQLFGEPGQIFSCRMTQSVILLSAFSLLSLTFVNAWTLRCLLLTTLLSLPFADYYMTMPKPEPLQLLFISAFLFYFKRSDMRLGSPYWIFLGLAFGTKISTLPFIVFFGVAATLRSLQRFHSTDASTNRTDSAAHQENTLSQMETHDSDQAHFSSLRPQRQLYYSLITASLLIGFAWLSYYGFGRDLISSMYERAAPIPFLNDVITSQHANSLEHFFAKAERLLVRMSIAVGLCVPIPFLLSLFQRSRMKVQLSRWLGNGNAYSTIRRVVYSGIYIACGLAIAVPILVVPTLLVSVSILTIDYLAHSLLAISAKSQCLICVASTVVTSTYAMTGAAYSNWFTQTFKNTGHGADLANVTFFTWANYFVNEWTGWPQVFTYLGFGLACVVTVRHYLRHNTKNTLSTRFIPSLPLLLIVAGLSLNLSICLFTKRLWGLYLFPGATIFTVGVFSLCDRIVRGKITHNSQLTNSATDTDRFLAYGLLALSLITTTFWRLPHSMTSFVDYARRTQSTQYRTELATHGEVTSVLSDLSNVFRRRFTVAFDPGLFPIQSSEQYQVSEFWGPYVHWEKKLSDVIVFSSGHTPNGRIFRPKSPEYASQLKECEDYDRLVVARGEVSDRSAFYERWSELSNGGEVLVLKHSPSKP